MKNIGLNFIKWAEFSDIWKPQCLDFENVDDFKIEKGFTKACKKIAKDEIDFEKIDIFFFIWKSLFTNILIWLSKYIFI